MTSQRPSRPSNQTRPSQAAHPLLKRASPSQSEAATRLFIRAAEPQGWLVPSPPHGIKQEEADVTLSPTLSDSCRLGLHGHLISVTLLLGLLVGTHGGHAHAESAFRCRDAQGQTSYTQLPCADKADTVALADHRTPAQQRQAAQNTDRDAKLARRLARERRKAEREAPREALITRLNPLPQPQAASAPAEVDSSRRRHRRILNSPYFTARTPIAAKTGTGAKAAGQ